MKGKAAAASGAAAAATGAVAGGPWVIIPVLLILGLLVWAAWYIYNELKKGKDKAKDTVEDVVNPANRVPVGCTYTISNNLANSWADIIYTNIKDGIFNGDTDTVIRIVEGVSTACDWLLVAEKYGRRRILAHWYSSSMTDNLDIYAGLSYFYSGNTMHSAYEARTKINAHFIRLGLKNRI